MQIYRTSRNTFRLKINHTVLWTDSTIVIHWLRSSELKDVFVRNRVSAIRKFPVSHLVSQDNPADIASRGTNAHALRNSKIWWKGPSWISTPITSWPNSELTYKPGDEHIKRESDTPFFAVDCAAALQEHTNIPLIDMTKFDRVHKAERILTFVLRFLKIKLGARVSRLSTIIEADFTQFKQKV